MTRVAGQAVPRWRLRDPLAHQKGIPRFPHIVATVLAARGITTRAQADFFYKPTLLPDYDPLELPGMQDAIARVRVAIANRETIALYGDFDVDGVTSVAILSEGLEALGATCRTYIPDRFTEGYGLNFGAVRQLREAGAGLLVTADCGICSVAEVAYANELGLDVIILDHHTGAGGAAGRARRGQPETPRFALSVRRAGRLRGRLPLPAGALRRCRRNAR